jgi:CelD/BcsL family acetyltransferase involved in cellulose biosynthesis
MQLTVIRTQEELDALETEWNEILTCCSASHVPFLRHEYISAWWRTLGGGEWEQAELYTIVIRYEDGQIVGIAPLFFTNNRQVVPDLMLLGSIEISDYLDLIIHSGEASTFLDILLAHLNSEQAPAWQVLDWYNIPENSPTLPALSTAAEKLGWQFNQERLQPCPYIPLPGDWETYLAGIDKKQRHEIRRKMRRAESYNEPVRWYFVDDENNLDREIEDFLVLMAQDPEKDRFLTEVMRSQMHAAVHAAFNAGWLQLSFLEVGGKKAAGYLNFDYDGHIWVYNSGINFDYGSISPGWVLLGYLLKWANENQRAAFDFMRGDEAYKYRFGGIDRFVVRAMVHRGSA